METQINEKEPKRRTKVTMALEDIPPSVHEKLKKYNRRINADRNKSFTIKQAYVEFLKEKTATV